MKGGFKIWDNLKTLIDSRKKKQVEEEEHDSNMTNGDDAMRFLSTGTFRKRGGVRKTIGPKKRRTRRRSHKALKRSKRVKRRSSRRSYY